MFVGLVGGLGLSLGNYLGLSSASAAEAISGRPSVEGKARSVIHIFLPGGIAQHESFDPKPDAPIEYRGPFGTIKTKLDGVLFGEHFKELAGIADKLCIIRSLTHGEAAHERGTHWMFTGYKPSPAISYPSMGSIVSHEFGPRNHLPPYVCVPSQPNPYAGSGYLSNAYGPFSLGADPTNGGFSVRDLNLPQGVDEQRFAQRKSMLAAVDDHFRTIEKSDALDSMGTFYQRAYALISSQKAREAFNLVAESDALKDRYGRNSAGMRMLLARRLVESGVRFVSLTYGGWDHHNKIAEGFRGQAPQFDKALAALVNDLDERNMLDSTLIMVNSEFGRTPKINKDDGRDHWPKVFSALMIGGGIKRGIAHGTSDAIASEPDENPVPAEDMAATMYNQLGIDPDKRLIAPGGRPIDIVRGGHVVKEIVA
ncbi:MAG: DUF1501 domain-containing protein [Tepidisphaeraceae bacterium]|jgi:hypothetical protein